ncbi:hypothetical protein Poli38472_002017 [Pythium oligandrum]|uniref:FYVE-type domain-containing protein n=1 Tax=Pythium oligandrum TaxID=41045 RepID=A0A8K1CU15_PYTOL|nr:hypothetical protein Poli38472_002017 [Pythium oligandrum]|eukprot:TMW69861.1 hypothetical protein Poli38472_002017 [Pythium oligandrum]
MKFPLPRNPFPPVQLTPHQERDLELLADQLLQRTVDEYDHFLHIQNREVDKTKWKHVKTRENMSVYKSFGDMSNDPHMLSHDAMMTPRGSRLSSSSVSGVRLLGVGSIVGNFADLMYAATTLDDGDMKIKSSYIPDECVDWRLLKVLKHGTEEDPFLCHTIKWVVKQAPGATSVIVRPRDMIILDCNGLIQMPTGERLGYMMHQSIEIPEWGELEGIVRCQVSACYLFRIQNANSVEVYMRSLIDAGGNVTDFISAVSSANALIATWKLPWGGQNKKLSWMLKQASAKRADANTAVLGARKVSKSKEPCPLCQKSVSMLRSVAQCELCFKQVCSRCLTVRKISHIRRSGELIQKPTAFCKQCVTQASQLDSTDIIRIDCIPKGYNNRSEATTMASISDSAYDPYRPSSVDSEAWTMTPMSRPDVWETGSVQIESSDDWERDQMQRANRAPSEPSGFSQQQQPLWMQMNQLRLAAEQAYQLTKQNENAMHQLH